MHVHNGLINSEVGQKLVTQAIEDLESKIDRYRNIQNKDQDTLDALHAWQVMSDILHHLK